MKINLDTKICTKCKDEKLVSEFPKDKITKDGFHPWCKSCNSERQKEYRKSISGSVVCKELDRKANLRKLGVTTEQWDSKFIEQKGRCGICGVHQSELIKRFATDHNHITMEFRGLLCDNCNRGIGLLKDNISVLLKAVDYLSGSKEQDGC